MIDLPSDTESTGNPTGGAWRERRQIGGTILGRPVSPGAILPLRRGETFPVVETILPTLRSEAELLAAILAELQAIRAALDAKTVLGGG